MKKVSGILTMLFLFIGFTGAYATNGMRLIGFGVIQDSMGGASVGVNLDAASVLTNPAGIQQLGGTVDFGASYFAPDVKTSMGGTEFSSDKGASPIPALGLVLPLSENVSFGLGAYGVSGMGVDYNMGTTLLYTSYSQMRFAPGIAYKINDIITAGVTLNVMYATMEYSMNPGTGQTVDMGASSFGYGATAGVVIKPVEAFSIGVAYETKSKFQDFKFNQYVSGVGVSENKLKFDQPMSATAGIGLKPINGLVLAFDVQWIRWSETNGNDLPKFTDGTFNMQWDNQVVYKFGLQYEVVPELLKVRAGVNYGKMPLSESNANALQANMFFPAVSEWHYTAGIGVNVTDKISVDAGYMYSPESKVDSTSGESKMSQYAADFGVGYKF